MFDAHTHPQFSAFDSDREEVIARAKAAGVRMLCVGTQRDTSAAAVALAHTHPGFIHASIGLHPIHTESSYHDIKELGGGEAAKAFTSRGEEFDYDVYKKLALDSATVAIGECGLDYYRLTAESKAKQAHVFSEHARLAVEVGKALMIHCRPSKGTDDAYEDMLAIASDKKYASVPKVVHFYVGSLAITKKLVAAGFHFTYGGVITFARDYDEQIQYIPIDRILLETDAPYVAPMPYRGKRNEPAYILETAKKMAQIKGIPYDEMTHHSTENSRRIFKL